MSDTTSIYDLTRPLTLDEARTVIYSVFATIGVDTTTWKPGAVVRTMVSTIAVLAVACSTLIAAIAKSGFLDFAEASWLTLTARYVYGVERILATNATGAITLTNSSGFVYDFAIGDVVLSSSLTGATFANQSAIHLGATSSVVGSIFSATAPGAASTAFGGEIDTLVSSFAGVTCTNPIALVGSDDEEDPALRIRCRDKLGALSPNGPLDAYAFVARSALRLDGSAIGITRVRATKDGFGNVDVWLAIADGALTGTVGDLTSDLGAADDAMQRKATPLAVTLRSHNATAVVFDVDYTLNLYNTSGLTVAAIELAVQNAIITFLKLQPIGGNTISITGKIYRDALISAISAAVPGVIHVTLATPADDTTLAISEVGVLGIVTPTIVQLAAPENA